MTENTVSGSTESTSIPPPCDHDSRRLDGWLGGYCTYCGLDGYWRNGVDVRALKGGYRKKLHPGGKVLIKERRA